MKKAALVVTALGFAAPAMAGGGVLYDNGAPDFSNGNEMTQWVQAEDFTGVDGTIGSVQFTFIDLLNSGLANWDGTIDWWIYNDGGGQPGGIEASGTGSNFNTSFDGNFNGWDNYTMTFDLGGGGVDVDAANTYYLGLNLNNGFTRDELYWTSTGPNGTDTGWENDQNLGAWFNNGVEHSYKLSGTGGAECTWDLDGDDVVGTGDLILLLGSWGDPYDTADLIELLGNWGPCPK